MSFVSEFKTIIEADPSINAIVPVSRIKLAHLIDNWELYESWLVWDYKIAKQYNTLSLNNCYTEYTLNITVTLNDTVVMNNLCDCIKNYLNNIRTSHFPDIYLTGDSKLVTLIKPKNTYQNTLTFTAIFLE